MALARAIPEAPSLALVVNTFNQPDYLARALEAIARQVQPPAEIILADDGSDDATRELFERWAAAHCWRCERVWQKRDGFRRARILNLAIAKASSDYLVFLDGDTLPHPRSMADHGRLAARGTFVQGHRALIQRNGAIFFGLGAFEADRRRAVLRGQLRGLVNAYRWPRPARRYRADLRGTRGCNLAIWRSDLVKVNGYNEAFIGWGREDSELAARLMNAGVRRLDVRGWALCYHLWHPPASRAGLATNEQLLQETLTRKTSWCDAGLNSHMPGVPTAAETTIP